MAMIQENMPMESGKDPVLPLHPQSAILDGGCHPKHLQRTQQGQTNSRSLCRVRLADTQTLHHMLTVLCHLQAADDFLSAVAEAADEAAQAASTAEIEKQQVSLVAAESQKLAAETKTKLQEAMPAVAAAQAALAALSKGDIGEIKAMSKPPSAVQLTMEVGGGLLKMCMD